MPRPRLRFTVAQLMILIAVVGLLLGVATWAYSDPNAIVVALLSLIVLGPICLQLYAILWRDTP